MNIGIKGQIEINCEEDSIMPVIIFDGPKVNREQKEQLVKEFTAIASRVTNIPRDAFITLIKENDPENVGVGGELLANKHKL